MRDRCAYPKCRAEPEIIYLDRPLCDKHWSLVCQDGIANKIRAKLGLPPLYVEPELPASWEGLSGVELSGRSVAWLKSALGLLGIRPSRSLTKSGLRKVVVEELSRRRHAV